MTLPQQALDRFAKQAGIVKGFSPDLDQLAEEQSRQALDLLDADYSSQPTWFSPRLQDVGALGPLLEGDLVIVGARPGGGKTTFLTEQTLHMVHHDWRVIYAGMEMSPGRMRLQLAAALAGYHVPFVVRGNWDRLPTGARTVVEQKLAYLKSKSRSLVLIPDERVSLSKLQDWAAYARKNGFHVIVVDHIHQMDWGGGGETLTAAMSEGLREMKVMAKREQVRLLVAAQLKRGQFDPLEDYMVPPQSAIKQSGAAEEVADAIIMLHRALRATATEGDLALVRRGQRSISAVAEDGTMVAHVAKFRLDGTVRDQSFRFYVGGGRLYETEEERARGIFHVGNQTRNPVDAAAGVPGKREGVPPQPAGD